MPLKVIARAGHLYIHGTVKPAGAQAGVRVRQRAGSDRRELAEEEARTLEAHMLRAAWHGDRPAVRSFAEAITSYLSQPEPRSRQTRALIRRLLIHFKEFPVVAIGQEQADGAVRALCQPGAAPSTVRRQVLVPLVAVLNHAADRGWCAAPRIKKPKEPQGRTQFLTPPQFRQLLDHAAPRLRPFWLLLACTGMRTGEALGLQWDEVDLRGARINLPAARTKARKARTVFLPPAAVAALAGVKGREGHVFRSTRRRSPDGRQADAAGLPYWGASEDDEGGGGQLRKPWARMCRLAEIEGITPHALRHTFATWHWSVHRDLFALRRAGGWATVAMVERYEHALPEGFQEEIMAIWGVGAPVAAVAQG